MKSVVAATVCCAVMAGCAADCGSDWYSTGQRDGRLGADSQIDSYAARYPGVVDRQRYEEGRQAGLAMRPRISAF